MLIFSFRARAGRLLLLEVFLLNIVLASHVLGMSVMCIFKDPFPAEDPLYAMLRTAEKIESMYQTVREVRHIKHLFNS